MDTTRWKSILVPREVYEEIKTLSKTEGRTIGGQLRLVFDWYKESQGENGDVRKPRGRTRGNTEKAK
mgnify:CR=1 FL=1|tara:strand:+ start:266 stop:466 length:201 start_codon:yes stop_codon:yes gene_type:complete